MREIGKQRRGDIQCVEGERKESAPGERGVKRYEGHNAFAAVTINICARRFTKSLLNRAAEGAVLFSCFVRRDVCLRVPTRRGVAMRRFCPPSAHPRRA